MQPRLELPAKDWRERGREPNIGRVTVQVATKDRPRELYGFLASLLAQTYQDWDLILVDDSVRPCWSNRVDAVRLLLEVISKMNHNVRAFHVKRRGIDKSYDVALMATESELGLREEDDHVLEGTYIEELVKAYDGALGLPYDIIGKGIACVAGLSLNPNDDLWDQPPLRDPARLRNFFYWDRGEHGKPCLIPNDDQRTPIVSDRVYWVAILHGMWLYNVQALREIGGFATVTNGWRGETATTLKLWQEGYSLWVAPRAVAYHLPGPPAQGSHRGLHGKQERAQLEEVFQEWLNERGERGCSIPIDLKWERLPQPSFS